MFRVNRLCCSRWQREGAAVGCRERPGTAAIDSRRAEAVLIGAPSVGVDRAQPAPARAGTTITVWEDFPNEALPQMQALANKWAATSGNTVKFVSTSQPGMGGGSQSVTGLLQLKAKNK